MHSAAVFDTGNGDCRLLWCTGCLGVISVVYASALFSVLAHCRFDYLCFIIVFNCSWVHWYGLLTLEIFQAALRTNVSRRSQRKVLSHQLPFEPCGTLCFVCAVHDAHLRFTHHVGRSSRPLREGSNTRPRGRRRKVDVQPSMMAHIDSESECLIPNGTHRQTSCETREVERASRAPPRLLQRWLFRLVVRLRPS